MIGLVWVLCGTGFIFFMTCAGSAMVFFFRKKTSRIMQTLFLGFAAGIMIAASVFGLLVPAITESESLGLIAWIPASGGFVVGILLRRAWRWDCLLPRRFLQHAGQRGQKTVPPPCPPAHCAGQPQKRAG